jgi:hypothetical protein
LISIYEKIYKKEDTKMIRIILAIFLMTVFL